MSEVKLSCPAPTNPQNGSTVQASCPTDPNYPNKTLNSDNGAAEWFGMPPAWPVFSADTGEPSTVGPRKQKALLGKMYPDTSRHLLGVSVDGIIDSAAAKKYPQSAGRYAVAVAGNVTIAAVLDGNVKPAVLSELWVTKQKDQFATTKSDGSGVSIVIKNGPMEGKNFPKYKTDVPLGEYGTWSKIGIVHWVNPSDTCAEVTVQLQMHTPTDTDRDPAMMVDA